MDADVRFAEVAVPVPLDGTFTYSIPAGLGGELQVGSRVQVPFGGRILTGIVLSLPEKAPEGVEPRPVSALLDGEPALPVEILEMARFVAEYYLAPIGEVLKGALPPSLSRTGERSWELTDRGLASLEGLEGEERELVEAILAAGRATAAELRERLGMTGVAARLETLAGRGSISSTDRWTDRKGTRWEKGVALREVDDAAIAAGVGRSPARRRVVEALRSFGRPALVTEVTAAAGCTGGPIRELEKAGVLSSFTQPCRYDAGAAWDATGAESSREIRLTAEQEGALATIAAAEGKAVLLRGVTGSGKSEVYARALQSVVGQGKKGIWLVPEIALTPVFARQLRLRFAGRLAVLHSALSPGERSTEWSRIRDGEVDVVLGPRSAIWAPALPLGLVVVDEEHEPSYKQDETPRYSARDLALWRGAREGAAVILGSATPSIESVHGAASGRILEARLEKRVEDRPLPTIELVDLRSEQADPGDRGTVVFSRRLRQAVEECLAAKEQAILLLNRRGYSPHLVCRECSEDFRCPDCSVARTYHKRIGQLVCHYCGRKGPAPPACPACGGAVLHPEGLGTERVLEKVLAIWPTVRADRLDRDTVRRRGGVQAVLGSFERGELDLIVGTQMVAKGHHFPNVTLTGVVNADGLLGFPDFRAGERTFQLLVQVAGRAGRGEKPGKVIVQTFHPEHPAVKHAVSGDVDGFYRDELRLRKAFHFPPYTRLVRILSISADRERARGDVERLARAIEGTPGALREARLLGPAPAPMERLQGKWRFHLLVRGENRRMLRGLVASALAACPLDRGAGVDRVVDVDPSNLM